MCHDFSANDNMLKTLTRSAAASSPLCGTDNDMLALGTRTRPMFCIDAKPSKLRVNAKPKAVHVHVPIGPTMPELSL